MASREPILASSWSLAPIISAFRRKMSVSRATAARNRARRRRCGRCVDRRCRDSRPRSVRPTLFQRLGPWSASAAASFQGAGGAVDEFQRTGLAAGGMGTSACSKVSVSTGSVVAYGSTGVTAAAARGGACVDKDAVATEVLGLVHGF